MIDQIQAELYSLDCELEDLDAGIDSGDPSV